ncbi:hypothetical protein HY635_03850 [Candidatus Uhrbacteria bacterium]|nr:hypothetical protein [Candidatus Uhrbacteria bacterium]
MGAERMGTGDKGPTAEPTPESVRALVADLSKARRITRDQERIADTALQDPDFALLANRCLNQGTDPELLLRTVPESVHAIAQRLGLTPEQAEQAIQAAHRTGPGSLPKDSPAEWLWLALAEHSLDEATKPKEPERVLAASARKIVEFERYAGSEPDVERDARAFRETILERTKPIDDAPQGSGIPIYDSDLGFYAAYRTGHPVAAVRTPDGLVFYGTDGSVTLEAAGITVDKLLSPTFGIVFPPKAE